MSRTIAAGHVAGNITFLEGSNETPWVTGLFRHPTFPDGVWFQAKVYNIPSHYGIPIDGGESRTSKLALMDKPYQNKAAPFLDQCIYHYDRGHDFAKRGKGYKALVRDLVKELEGLPPLFTADDE